MGEIKSYLWAAAEGRLEQDGDNSRNFDLNEYREDMSIGLSCQRMEKIVLGELSYMSGYITFAEAGQLFGQIHISSEVGLVNIKVLSNSEIGWLINLMSVTERRQ